MGIAENRYVTFGVPNCPSSLQAYLSHFNSCKAVLQVVDHRSVRRRQVLTREKEKTLL